ncbi:MAG: hypothetical protein ACTSVO_09415 [Candidatus Heimdallarchaeaceae archaeon]
MKKTYSVLVMIIFILLEILSTFAAQDSSSTDNAPWIIFLTLFAVALLYAIIAHKLKKID